MSDKRIVDINIYWTEIIRDTAQFGQIAVAENPEFNKLSECIFNVLEDSFISSTTSEYGVERWEKMLDIVYPYGATLDERKAAIVTRLNLKIPYTWNVLKQLLYTIAGNDYELYYDNDNQTLVVEIDEVHREKLDDLFSRVVPMNVVCTSKNKGS